ncbi:SDR family oxidoreductase [Paenibacillus sp. XY044]|uniref:SDR family oxidoreductase n=1 Tax=Paenibacillus sp. XY044 TaxID=2026089 RepID=UPI000B9934E3|nr:SDR family oxidoreductase [Paenibacillus sp. XY044]OZB91026.1 short-chain dehydrogenase [Paenibacillus sp. XY044]
MGVQDERPVVLVTGSSSGFGLLACVELAVRGYAVFAGMRRPEASGELMKAAQTSGALEHIHVVGLDVTDGEQVLQAVSGILKSRGRIDVLVNNAGTAYGGMIEEIPMDVWKAQLETNFFGMVAVTQAVLPAMREARKGKIIQISSISGAVGFPGFGPYVSSKFAVEGFSECLALEMRPFGVDVVVVEPGSYGTAIWDKGFAQMSTADRSPYERMLNQLMDFSRNSADQRGDPADVARLIARIARMNKPAFRYALPAGTRWTMAVKPLLPGRLFQRIMLALLSKKG